MYAAIASHWFLIITLMTCFSPDFFEYRVPGGFYAHLSLDSRAFCAILLL